MYHGTFIIKYRTLGRLFDAIEMVNNDFIHMMMLKYRCDNTCYTFPKGVFLAPRFKERHVIRGWAVRRLAWTSFSVDL